MMAEGTIPQEVDVVTSSERKSWLYPKGFWPECKALFKLTWPTSLSILFHYMIQPISLAFCGHLGKNQLAAVALALSFIYIVVVGIGRGLAFAGDTFFSQVYGSDNKKLVGIYLQRGIYMGVLTACPMCAILFNTEILLRHLGQDPEVCRLVQEFVLYFMPGTLAYNWLFLLMRYLLCQNCVIPNLVICVISCAINAVLNYGLVYQAQIGINGSAIALMLTYYLVFIFLVSYIWGSGLYRETWSGWSWKALEDWGPMGTIAVYSIGLNFILWLSTESGTYLAGILGKKELSSYSIMFQVEGFAWMVPLGLGGACAARVGQFLGAYDPDGAKTSTRVAFTIQAFISLAFGVAAYLLRYYIPRAFTSDRELIDYTAGLMPILALYLVMEGYGGVGLGIVRGSGRQKLGSLIIFLAYYVGGLPVGISLMFLTNLKMRGLWWGYFLALCLLDAGLLLFVGLVNWQKEADKAQIRAEMSGDYKDDVDKTGSINNPDESTGLLSSSSSHTSNNRPRTGVLLLRFFTLVFFLCIFAAGFLLKMYLPLPEVTAPMEPLCIPLNTTAMLNTTSAFLTSNGSSILPFCNVTSTAFPFTASTVSFYAT